MLTLACCQDHILTENIWFVWSETSYSGDERRCYRCGTTKRRRQTTEDRATQPMEAGGWVSQYGLLEIWRKKFQMCLTRMVWPSEKGLIPFSWLVTLDIESEVCQEESLELSCSFLPNILPISIEHFFPRFIPDNIKTSYFLVRDTARD